MKPYRLVIFDMDGLMFETGRLAYTAYLRSAQYYDYEMIHNVYYILTGMTNSDIIKKMKELYGDDQDVAKWRAKIVEEKAKILEEQKRVYKKKGLMEVLSYLHQNHILCALASSSCREVIDHYLQVEGLKGQFDFITAGDEVRHGKPSPEIFLTSCDKANVEPNSALVLEDSLVGIRAAQAGKIDCCLIEDDIRDMPVHRTGCPLKETIEVLPRGNVKPTYEKVNLLEVIELLKE